jgi:UDP-2,3-diacylglucosamine hydrolase
VRVAQLFISDLHLSPARPLIVSLFESFLRGPAQASTALYILGDLFEYWAGDDDLSDAFNSRIAQSLSDCSRRGTRVFFMHGNRDFLAGDAFARACGLTLLTDPARVQLDDGEVLLSHGDALCTDDHEYQAFRTTVRSPAWRRSFLERPLAERKAEIEALRAQSETQKRIKPAAIMDVNEAAVCDLFRRENATRLIHGHTHRPAHHRHSVDGSLCDRWVLADWYDSGSYLHCDETGIRSMAWTGG